MARFGAGNSLPETLLHVPQQWVNHKPPDMAFICLELPSEEPSPTQIELNMDFIPKSLLSQNHGYRTTTEAAWGVRSFSPGGIPGWLRVPAAGGMEKVPGHVLVSRMSPLSTLQQLHTDTGCGGDSSNRLCQEKEHWHQPSDGGRKSTTPDN